MLISGCRGAAAAGNTEQHSERRDHPSQTGAPAASQGSGPVRYIKLHQIQLSLFIEDLFGRSIRLYCRHQCFHSSVLYIS